MNHIETNDLGLKNNSLLEVVDELLDTGVVISGQIRLGVADVDLIHGELRLLLSSIEKLEEGNFG